MVWNDVNLFAYTHSGSTYLLNILLELDICIFRGTFENFWIERSDSTFELERRQQVDLGVWFPRFQAMSQFAFNYNTRICWDHGYPSSEQLTQPMILVVRDLRDVLFSFYNRTGDDLSFYDFLSKPVPPRDFGLFGLYPAYEWALYYGLLSELGKDNMCVIRFEDMRADAENQVKRVLAFLNIAADDHLIRKAILNSGYEAVRTSTDRWYQLHPELRVSEWKAMRRGKIGEWREAFGDKEEKLLRGLPSKVAQRFAYYTEPAASPNSKDDLSDVNADHKKMMTGLRYVEDHDGRSAMSAFFEAAAQLDGDPETAIILGRAIACCLWVVKLHQKINCPDGARALKVLLHLSSGMGHRPLILVAASRGLAAAGNIDHAIRMLPLAETWMTKSRWEMIEIGKAYLTLGDRRRARTVLGGVIPAIPLKEQETIVRFLLQHKAAVAVAHALRACGFTNSTAIMFSIFRDKLRQIPKPNQILHSLKIALRIRCESTVPPRVVRDESHKFLANR